VSSVEGCDYAGILLPASAGRRTPLQAAALGREPRPPPVAVVGQVVARGVRSGRVRHRRAAADERRGSCLDALDGVGSIYAHDARISHLI
jgi:hypothetical protein